MAPAQSVETQIGILSERVAALNDTVERRFDEFGKAFKGVQDKQAARDTHCAGESESNAEIRRQVAELWHRVENSDECRTCKNTERLAKMEISLGILSRVSWLLATSTASLMVKLAFELLSHSK
jgi:hypothetical protein